jgi:hypothetical protein
LRAIEGSPILLPAAGFKALVLLIVSTWVSLFNVRVFLVPAESKGCLYIIAIVFGCSLASAIFGFLATQVRSPELRQFRHRGRWSHDPDRTIFAEFPFAFWLHALALVALGGLSLLD